MGRKRRRKRERQLERREQRARRRPAWYSEVEPSEQELLAIMSEQDVHLRMPADDRCGSCAEFVEDELTSRGTCLHPGSGIVSPWTDTEACDFFTSARRRGPREFYS